jgi:subtilisin family serine protease
MLTSHSWHRHAVRTSILSVATLLVGAVSAQNRQVVPSTDAPSESQARESVYGGEVRHVPITSLEDGVPTPGLGIRYEETPNGVREILPADTDPYSLGFAAGKYSPPVDERVDPALRAAAAAIPLGREQQVTFGFAMFSKRITEDRIARLEELGVSFLGRHPHYAAKVAIPAHALDAVADLDFIRWIGVPRDWQKLHPLLLQTAQRTPADQTISVWINLYSTDQTELSTFDYIGSGSLVGPEMDGAAELPAAFGAKRWQSNGWQQASLEAIGVDIRDYADQIQAFRADLTPAELAAVQARDFVQFIELDAPASLYHEESQPMCGVDINRGTNSGGTFGNAVIGEVDSGIETSHLMLNHIWGWGWDLTGLGSPWDDTNSHGTHVAGTIFGGAFSGNEAMYGAAPGLGSAPDLRIFNIRGFDASGFSTGWPLTDVFDRMHTDLNDGTNITPYPHVVNNSWGGGAAAWIGSEADARLIDNEVYVYGQLYTFATGNSGPSTSSLSVQASAKNAFSVGNVVPYRSSAGPPDTVRGSSSRGPCGDGRWKPNVMAPGTSIDSANAFDQDGFSSKTGTSMATPHVTGIAATVVDRHSFLRYNASTLSAVLMATALSKSTHTWPTDSHLDTYGAGRISAYRAINGNSNTAMLYWGYSQSASATAELDFTVGAGATRVTVVMTYHEIASSAGASKALVSDVDCYIDRSPFTGSGNSGDWFNQISHIDNTEIRTINSPVAGSYKVKTYPNSVSSSFAPRMGVCVIVDYGDTTPSGTLSITSSEAIIQPGDALAITGSVTNPSSGSIAQSVYLDASMGGMSLSSVKSLLADGAVSELINNANSGSEVMLGDMRQGQTRSVTWEGTYNSEGTKTFSASTLSPTMDATSDSVQVIVDGTAPGLPQSLQSTDHTVNQNSCDLTVAMDWDPASDSLSGVAGYSYQWSNSSGTTPDASIDTTATSSNTALSASSSGWWFHVRAVDKAGNAGSAAHSGPYFLGEAKVTNYCNSNLNSTGMMAHLGTQGPVCLANDQFTLHTINVPLNQWGHYFFGVNKANVPFFGGSQGILCVGGPIIRFIKDVKNSGSAGTITLSPDMNDLPNGANFLPGSTWNFQLWYRDKNPGNTSNTSNAIEVIWD